MQIDLGCFGQFVTEPERDHPSGTVAATIPSFQSSSRSTGCAKGATPATTSAAKKGFFREAVPNITIVRSFGSGRVPTDIAAGAYDMGQGNISAFSACSRLSPCHSHLYSGTPPPRP